MLYLTDQDARPFGAANPLANLWDNGDDPVQMLRHEMEVRRIGLAQFGLGNIPTGTPLSLLEAKLLPLCQYMVYVEMSDRTVPTNSDLWNCYLGLARQHPRMQGDARPRDALHEGHVAVLVDIGGVNRLLLHHAVVMLGREHDRVEESVVASRESSRATIGR